MEFLIHNGAVLSKQEVNLNNLVLQSSFSLSQKIWFGYGGIPLLAENIKLLEEQLATFQSNLPEMFSNQRELFRLCKRMLNKNRFYLSGWINIQLFVTQSKIDFLLTAIPSKENQFPINERGFLAEVSQVNKTSNNPYNVYQAHNMLLWEAINASKTEPGTEVLLILNDKHCVCESAFSNVFMLKENVLFTPSLATGCYHDVLYPLILNAAKECGLQTAEVEDIATEHLCQMDEVFLASEAKGIQWVLGVKDKRYINKLCSKIHVSLNEFLKQK